MLKYQKETNAIISFFKNSLSARLTIQEITSGLADISANLVLKILRTRRDLFIPTKFSNMIEPYNELTYWTIAPSFTPDALITLIIDCDKHATVFTKVINLSLPFRLIGVVAHHKAFLSRFGKKHKTLADFEEYILQRSRVDVRLVDRSSVTEEDFNNTTLFYGTDSPTPAIILQKFSEILEWI